jgi:uncharacterized repeat protein (TIGR02543 family)
MRRISTFVLTAVLSLSGLLFSPAQAAINCDTGSFTVTQGVVSDGSSCTGEAIIPASVTIIGDSAFRQAYGLTKVTFASTSNLLEIEQAAFEYANVLSSITIPTSVTDIGAGAFAGTSSLTSIFIPASVISIQPNAFYSNGIMNFAVAAGNNTYTSENNVLFNKGKTTLIRFLSNSTGEYVVPSSVTTISEFAFAQRNITGLVLPAGLQNIEPYALVGASGLASVNIPESLTIIGPYAFASTSALRSITFPATVIGIDASAFGYSAFSKELYFLGNEPEISSIYTSNLPPDLELEPGSTAYALVGVDGFPSFAVDATWKGADLMKGRLITFLGNGNTSGLSPNKVLRGVGNAVNAPGNSGVLTKTGYVFAGWNTEANGSGTTYAVGSSALMPDNNLELHAKWTAIPLVKAVATVKPSITGTATATTKGTNKLTAKKGTWTGYPAPSAFTYQWYSCTAQLKSVLTSVPRTCTKISRATSGTLAVTNSLKGKYLAVLVSGKSAGTSATISLSKSTLKVK